jgi:RND family efflux transporter MFP subunit
MTYTFFMRGCAFVALVAAGLMLASCDSGPAVVEAEPPVVTVSQPLEKEITDYEQYTGRVEAAETVEVRARVRGELVGISFKDGALVNEGDPLFEIDPRVYKTAVDVAMAKKDNAQASVKLAETEYKRNLALFQRDAGAAKDVEMWTAKRSIALAEMSQADAEIERAKLDLEFTKIKAPISGRISRSLVTKGNMVNFGGGDTLLTTIVSVDPIFVYFDVDENSLKLYRERRAKENPSENGKSPPSIPAFLGLMNDEHFSLEGKIDFADNRINPATGTIRVRGVFANKDGKLTPGQFARIHLPVGEKYKGLLVTDQAVGTDQSQKYLLIVNSDNKVEYRLVTPGRLDGNLRIFRPDAGLKAGEWVIVNGVQRIRPGMVVKPERVPMPTLPADESKADTDKKPN